MNFVAYSLFAACNLKMIAFLILMLKNVVLSLNVYFKSKIFFIYLIIRLVYRLS